MMNEKPSFLPKRWWRITAVLLVGAGGAVLLAIFVFDVAVKTAVSYGLLGLFLVSHLFMHGGHGGHGHNHADFATSDDAEHVVELKVTEEQSPSFRYSTDGK